jgi:DnaK suppressor protein
VLGDFSVLGSILKFVGLSSGKSLQSAADLKSVKQPKQGITLDKPETVRSASHGAAGSARRQEVKAPVKKSTAVKKPVIKAKAAPAKKAVVKPVSKPVPKPKPASKPAPKAAAKPTAKKPAAKPAVKKVVKTVAKPVSKAVKAPVKTVVKPAAKAAATHKPVPSARKKVSTQPVIKQSATQGATVKAVSPPPSKASAKAVAKAPAKAPAKPAVQTAKPVAPAQPAKPAVAKAAPAMPTAPVAPPAKPRTSKSGFTSPANIAPKPMEVSTAAKTNFTMSAPVLAPPPQLAVKKDAKLVNNWKTKTAAQLTDAEVIAMPDSEYMSALQLAFFRLKLVQLKKDILSNAGETTEHLREDTSVVPDPADRATIEEEHALELRTRDRERKLLKKIEQSISRIDAEDYGYCDETGEPIGVARLIARPTASLSLEAQQRRELKQKMFGD